MIIYLQRIQREFVCIGMSVVLVAAYSLFPNQQIQQTQATVQSNDVIVSLSSVQYEGARPYFIINLVASGFVYTSCKAYVNSENDPIVNEIVELGVGVDMSVYDEFFLGCSGVTSCDVECNICMQNYIRNCALKAVGIAIGAGLGISAVCWKVIAGTALTGIGALAATIACALAYVIAAGGSISEFYLCKWDAPGNCSERTNCDCHL